MYVYDDEPYETNKNYDGAIKKIWDYLDSDEFVSAIAEKVPQFYLSAMMGAKRSEIDRRLLRKERKKYDDLLARLRMAECVLRDHGALEEYQKMWMGKEDEGSN